MPKDHSSDWGPLIARRILADCLEVKAGETVLVEAWTKNLPWAECFEVEARELGALPLITYDSDAAYWKAFENGRLESIGTFSALDKALFQNANAFVYLYGPSDRSRLLRLPEDVLKQLFAYEHDWMKLVSEGNLRWCRVELTRVTPKLAKEYGVNYERWLKEIFEASMVEPGTLSELGKRVSEKIERGKVLRITHPNGTDLELHLNNRRSIVSDGKSNKEAGMATHGSTIPSGAVLTSVDEDYAEGSIISNQITRFGTGRPSGVGAKWTMRGGHLQEYSYYRGVEEFRKDLKKIGEGMTKPAGISIGLNPKIRKAPLFEIYEKGAISFAIGSNEEFGGGTKGHNRTWIVVRGATAYVDGEAIVRNGKFA
jgi:leucyl aminopeptidase (aminopeptidase T)